ncbi:MAG TPA: hypothetical protein VER96_11855 [Polyangiaceae bacterium]|nr:hypothetical protein [Polyangiaceae bacterium]
MTHTFRTGCAPLAWGAALLALSLLPRSASATPNTDQCIDADTQAQDLRRGGKLLSARAALQICTDPACPQLVREDCTQRLNELTHAVPSLIFSAKDGTGRALNAVAVTIDGKPLVDHLDGSAIAVDPGQHTFGFQAAGLSPATLKLQISEGEHARRHEILLGPAPAETAPPPQPPTTNADADAALQDSGSSTDTNARATYSVSTQRVLAYTALGLGATGIVVGSVFGLKSKSKHDDASACDDTSCPDEPSYQANKDAIKFGNISTVSFIVGAVGLAGGVALWLTEKPNQASSKANAQIGVGLGSVQLRGRF